MEEKIREIINDIEKFKIVDFINEDEEKPDSRLYLVQLRKNDKKIFNDELNFDNRADILLSYDSEQINIYAKISDKFVEKDMQDLINSLSDEFRVIRRFSNRSSIYRFDTLNLKNAN